MSRRLARLTHVRSLPLCLSMSLALSACGGGGLGGDDPDGGVDPAADLSMGQATEDLASPPDLLPPPTRLIELDYEIPAGGEFYQCQRITLQEDVIIKTFIPVNGVGTHHEVFAIDPTGRHPDGVSRCGPLDTKWISLFASGVGSPPLRFPDGVGVKIPKGKQIVLDLHLFNASQSVIKSKASLDVELLPLAELKQEAEVLLAGNVMFSIPPGDDKVVSGGCTMSGATNFFALFPHMHQTGKHMKVWAKVGGQRTEVHNAAYLFEEQAFYSFAPIPMKAGDRIEVECTYNNQTGKSIGFGDSSTEEMCFAISYRYPKLGALFGGICPF